MEKQLQMRGLHGTHTSICKFYFTFSLGQAFCCIFVTFLILEVLFLYSLRMLLVNVGMHDFE